MLDETRVGDMLEAEYRKAVETLSDINEHLPLLRELATSVSRVTEFGVRQGNSTRAFLAAGVRLRSYDLTLDGDLQTLFDRARAAGRDVSYQQADVLKVDIEETDLLFIDTRHTYQQLSLELKRHADKARRYMVFHDTDTFGVMDEPECGPPRTRLSRMVPRMMRKNTAPPPVRGGLLPAILRHLAEQSGDWRVKTHLTHNNGLTVIERTRH